MTASWWCEHFGLDQSKAVEEIQDLSMGQTRHREQEIPEIDSWNGYCLIRDNWRVIGQFSL
jgi:hypothetical protein